LRRPALLCCCLLGVPTALHQVEFRSADPNGNGLCSLAELETWLLVRPRTSATLRLLPSPPKINDIFALASPVDFLCSLSLSHSYNSSPGHQNQRKLLAAFPKDQATKVEKGKDLWELFRPSYIRAFNDAKDYKKDDGKVLDGTKNSTNDDFVSKGEFRLFCAYA